MLFCFVNLRPAADGHGWQPDFPDGVSFSLLADLQNIGWGLYSCEPPEANEAWRPSSLVDEQLAALIYSGMRYPPALALARVDMSQLFRDGRPSQHEFAEAYAASLRFRLSQQDVAPFVLARSLQDHAIDLAKGEWYWVLKLKGAPPIAYWVSDDYFVYQNPASYFDLTEDQVERLHGNEAA